MSNRRDGGSKNVLIDDKIILIYQQLMEDVDIKKLYYNLNNKLKEPLSKTFTLDSYYLTLEEIKKYTFPKYINREIIKFESEMISEMLQLIEGEKK